jgi:hypothetical protein
VEEQARKKQKSDGKAEKAAARERAALAKKRTE